MSLRRPAALLLASIALLAGCGDAGPSATAPTSAAAPPAAPPATASPSPVPSVSRGQSSDDVAWVVYQSPDGLRLIHPVSGTSRRVLPDGPAGALHPDWSPDGARLAFAVDDADGTRDVWTSDWDGSNAAVLVDCRVPCRDADSPAWSPDGTRIAFHRIDNVDGRNPGSTAPGRRHRHGCHHDPRVHDGCGVRGGPEVVARRTARSWCRSTATSTTATTPRRSPDRRSAWWTSTPRRPSIRVIRELETFSTYPDWHPTDDLILFAAGARRPLDPADAPSNLFTIRPDGTGLTQLTRQGPDDDGIWMPAYRPDGSGILATLVGRPDFALTLVSLAADGTGLADLDDVGPTSGAHSRQRPLPQSP